MATETPSTTSPSDSRALASALAAPAFTTRTAGLMMHTASRHVERWAPEAEAGRVRPLRSLGFVDRLVAPWLETAQRSAGLRMFSQYIGYGAGFAEREAGAVSWVFPRPWYQDELDWMAAARHVTRPLAAGGGEQRRDAQPAMLTTRGTYVPPARSTASVPAALYEYVAPSLSVARGATPTAAFDGGVQGVGQSAGIARDVYSPLVPLAAVQAAQLVTRTMAQLTAPTIAPTFSTPATRAPAAAPTVTPALRAVLATMLARTASPAAVAEAPTSRWALAAPALETPPAPRPEPRTPSLTGEDAVAPSAVLAAPEAIAAERIAVQLAEQRARVVELQRAAQQAIAREFAARAVVPTSPAPSPSSAPADLAQQRALVEAAQQRAIAQRAAQLEAQRGAASSSSAGQAQRTAEAERGAAVQRAVEAQRGAEAQRVAEAQAAEAQVSQAQRAAEIARLAAAAGADPSTPPATSVAERVSADAVRQQARAPQAEGAAGTLEERIAQRATAARLHEQARVEAARDARRAPATQESTPLADPRVAASQAAVAALAAALSGPLAALAPELAAIVAVRPERAAQVIGELSEALRAAELMSRATATGHAFEVTRGPRLAMPTGLGGLVATVERARPVEPTSAPIGTSVIGARSQATAAPTLGAPRARSQPELRVPTLAWVSAGSAGPTAPMSALGATAAASPHALQHVAWADRWLARFAGAQATSLDALTYASAGPTLGVASAAPGSVYVAPMFDAPAARAGLTESSDGGLASGGAASTLVAGGTRAPAPLAARGAAPAAGMPDVLTPSALAAASSPAQAVPSGLVRVDETHAASDDEFAAVAVAAARSRGAQVAAARAARGAPIAPAPDMPAQLAPSDRASYADVIAHAVPTAPHAGLSAQLASSPFAPALRHLLPMPAAPTFDVRALFGGALSASYLAGILGESSREIATVPAFTTPIASAFAAPFAASADGAPSVGAELGGAVREPAAWDATYVAPERAVRAEETALGDLSAAAGIADAAAQALPAAPVAARAEQPGYVAGSPTVTDSATRPWSSALLAEAARSLPALTTLRSALLAWDVEIPGSPATEAAGAPARAAGGSPGPVTSAASIAALGAAGPARVMLDAMTLPMSSDALTGMAAGGGVVGSATPSATWAAPGMVAERAQSWSVAQERSAADLSFDFVTPELVLAARVYGLGPAEAAQAARIALAGPGQLAAMAGAVDRTFVQAMAAEADRRDARARAVSAYPVSASPAGDVPAADVMARPAGAPSTAARDARAVARAQAGDELGTVGAPFAATPDAIARAAAAASSGALTAAGVASAASVTSPATSPFGAALGAELGPALGASSGTSFGIERRTPRGAFLWPSATVAALQLHAAGPDGQLSMSVAALELLAAQAVAEIGTYAAFADARPDVGGRDGDAGDAAEVARSGDGAISAARSAARERAAELGLDPDTRAAVTQGAVSATSAPSSASPSAAPAWDAQGSSPRDGFDPTREPSERDVLAGAVAILPAARRARFEAMYVALGQTPAARSLSPAARAARALALAGRGEDAPTSTRERASAAWDVLPVVYAMGDAAPNTTIETGTVAAREHAARLAARGPRAGAPGAPGSYVAPSTAARPGQSAAPAFSYAEAEGSPYAVDTRPGLSALSARAGEALGAYVQPIMTQPAPTPAPAPTSRETGAVLRAPTAAQELVRTGRPSGRFGGGEVEIPTWFENAARKMFEDKGNVSDGISLADLTLVTAAPQTHIAASTRSAPSAAPAAPSPDTGAGATPAFDIDRIAHEVYRQILVLMDNARARNGEPFL